MVEAGVPVIPGSKEPVYTVEEGEKIAGEIGYPIIVKAALGGGGKGMRVAQTPDEFQTSFQTAQKEAQMAFGDGTMYLEQCGPSWRKRLFHSEKSSEDDRGISVRSTDTGIETEDGRSGCESGESSSLYECRND